MKYFPEKWETYYAMEIFQIRDLHPHGDVLILIDVQWIFPRERAHTIFLKWLSREINSLEILSRRELRLRRLRNIIQLLAQSGKD